jgi:hypothetical protein
VALYHIQGYLVISARFLYEIKVVRKNKPTTLQNPFSAFASMLQVSVQAILGFEATALAY